jgi:hypothetical protein
MTQDQQRTRDIIKRGAYRGWQNYQWLAKLFIPFSFLMAILQWTGWLLQAGNALNPLMQLLSLPGEAAIPIIAGVFTNTYATIAIISAVPFSAGQMVLIAVFVLICHSLIFESIIQHRAGITFPKIFFIRLAAAILATLFISQFLADTAQPVAMTTELAEVVTFSQMVREWVVDMGILLLKIAGIIIGIMITIELLREKGGIAYINRFLGPFLRSIGLSHRTAILWVTAVSFGVFYGGAVIMEEAKNQDFKKAELDQLHISIGINHSMIEDPLLFLATGINGFWLWIPRLVTAIVAVQIDRGVQQIMNRLPYHRKSTVHE